MMPRWWFDWAEKGADPNRKFSPVVIGRFFLAMFATIAVMLSFKMMLRSAEQARQETARQEQMARDVQEMLESGEAGEAFQRLYSYQPKEKQQPTEPKPALKLEVQDQETTAAFEQYINNREPLEPKPRPR